MAEEVIPVSSGESEEEYYEGEEDDEEDDENEEKDGRSKILTELNDIIYEIEAPGTFACGGPIKLILPGLHINGFGEVSLPLRERDAKEIIALCQQAPFGRGEQTIVDTTVRNTWQLNPSELQILNEEFVQQIDSLVKDTVAIELGLGPAAKVAARLYKMLLYEPGGFFVPHKDTEKEPGMFASMVITLPSHFKGGELVVSHQGMEKTFTPEKPSYSTSYVSFFADCKHEIKPVTSGYRLALVYNVVSLGTGPLPRPASNVSIFQAMRCLKRWNSNVNGPSKAIFILSHQYTPAGLSVQVLKNTDRAIAQTLQEANKDQDFDIYLGLLNVTRSGPAEGGYRGDWSLMDEYCDESYELHSLVNLNGEHVKVDVSVDKKDIYPVDYFDDDGPDSESVEEATGNEGTSIELRYHKAVIMLWPKSKLINVICEKSETDAVNYLVNMIAKCSNIESRDDPAWQTCKQTAQTLIQKRIKWNSSFLLALNMIGDPQLVSDYLLTRNVLLQPYDFDNFCVALDQSIERFGWSRLGYAISVFTNGLSLELATVFVTHLIDVFQQSTAPHKNECLGVLANDLIKTRIPHDPSFILTPTNARRLTKIALSVNPALLTDIFVFIYSRFKSVDTEFIPTIKMLYEDYGNLSFNPTFVDLVQRCIAFLYNRIVAFQSRPDDWAILTPQSCSCVECQKIGAFLRSPTERVFRYPSALYNRKHVQDAISRELIRLNILDFQTETRGSPHTLIITKLTKELDFARQGAKEDAALIAQLNTYITLDESEQERAAKRQKTSHSN